MAALNIVRFATVLLLASLFAPSTTAISAAEPVVGIRSDRPRTSEPLPLALVAPGRFVLTRSGDLSAALTVFLHYSGTATADDVGPLPEWVTFLPGVAETNVEVFAKSDDLIEGTEVLIATVLSAAELPQTPAGASNDPVLTPYSVDPARRVARVEIGDEDRPSSDLPLVSILANPAETSEPGPTIRVIPGAFVLRRTGPTNTELAVNIQIGGTARPELDYTVLPQRVVFRPGEASVVLRVQALDDNSAELDETVVARLLDSSTFVPTYQIDSTQASATVVIHDTDRIGGAPRITITKPLNGDVFPVGQLITIEAESIDPNGYIPRVEFYDRDRLIGVSEIVFVRAPDPGTVIHHSLEWTNAAAGEHVLTARGIDNQGTQVVSGRVVITVGREHAQQVVLAITTRDGSANDSRSDDPAVFRIVRVAGERNIDVPVYLQTGGTAQNGVDYEELPSTVTLPAGTEGLDVVVRPITDKALEGEETVVLTLVPPVCVALVPPPAQCYLIARDRGSARAVIRDIELPPTNTPPRVVLLRPRDGASFAAGANIEALAEAADANGKIASLELRAGGVLLGRSEGARLQTVWSNAPAGNYTLTAVAVDDQGATTESATARIYVRSREATLGGGNTDLEIAKCERDSNGMLRLVVNGGAGQVCALEISRDLRTWEKIEEVFLPSGELTIQERPQLGTGGTFYRLRAL